MKRIFATSLVLALAACGGGEPAEDTAPDAAPAPAPAPAADAEPGAPASADWIQYDEGTNTVTLDIVAGATNALNYWNFNGLVNGEATITVPEGATVVINFSNEDPAMTHSVGVTAPFDGMAPANLVPEPAFEGAISANAADMATATASGATETITFVASTAGEYVLACFVPAHAATGMWLGFNVSASGEVGLSS